MSSPTEPRSAATRYLYGTPGRRGRVMHYASFDRLGNMTGTALCGRSGFSRSINAPWGLGRPICRDCRKVQP